MHALFVDLTALLRQEIDQYRRMLVLVRRERRRIVKGELAGLLELVRMKEALGEELASTERSRTCLLDRLAEAQREERAALSLARVADLAPAEMRDTLRALLAEFRGVVGRLMAANDVNRTLLDRSLEFVQRSLSLFRAVATVGPTYGMSGALEAPGQALVAINRLA